MKKSIPLTETEFPAGLFSLLHLRSPPVRPPLL
jgi:hypothetical protein